MLDGVRGRWAHISNNHAALSDKVKNDAAKQYI